MSDNIQLTRSSGWQHLLGISCVILVLAAAQLAGIRQVYAFSMAAELTAGYDDNAPLEALPRGSAFTAYRFAWLQYVDFPDPDLEMELYGGGAYQDYFRLADNYQLNMGGVLSSSFAQGRLRPAILSELTFYRDELLVEDEHNGLLAGVRLEWLMTGRLTLELTQLWSWQDYGNPQLPWSGQKKGGQSGQGQGDTFPARDDFRQSTGVQGIFYLLPDLEATLSLEYATLSSSIAREEYERMGVQVAMAWFPAHGLEVSGYAAVGENDFNHTPDGDKREDSHQAAGLRLGYSMGRSKLFMNWTWQENDSSLTYEDYTQTVTLCGFSFSF